MYKKLKLLIIFLILFTSCFNEPIKKTSFNIQNVQQELLALHLKVRKKPLILNDKLTSAAQKHANWMAKHNTLSHLGDSLSQPWDRATQEDYHYSSIGENIATGDSQKLNEIMDRWMASKGHRNNILSDFKDVGIGVASNNNITYFVVLFAR